MVQRRGDQADQPCAADSAFDHDHLTENDRRQLQRPIQHRRRTDPPEQQQHDDGDHVSVHARRGADARRGTDRLFAAQAGGSGTVHPTAGDTFTATYTIGGVSYTQTGHFSAVWLVGRGNRSAEYRRVPRRARRATATDGHGFHGYTEPSRHAGTVPHSRAGLKQARPALAGQARSRIQAAPDC